MANHCDAKLVFYGEKRKLEKLRKDVALFNRFTVANRDRTWLGKFFEMNNSSLIDSLPERRISAFVEDFNDRGDSIEIILLCHYFLKREMFRRLGELYSLQYHFISEDREHKEFINTDIQHLFIAPTAKIFSWDRENFGHHKEHNCTAQGRMFFDKLFEYGALRPDDNDADLTMDQFEQIVKTGLNVFGLPRTISFENFAAVISTATNQEIAFFEYKSE